MVLVRTSPSSPIAPVERPVLNCFRQVRNGQFFSAFQVGNGARNFENAIMRPGSQSLLLHCTFEQAFGVRAQFEWTRIWRVVICALA